MEFRLPATVSLVVGCTIVKEDLFSFLKLLRDPCLGEARDRMAKVPTLKAPAIAKRAMSAHLLTALKNCKMETLVAAQVTQR